MKSSLLSTVGGVALRDDRGRLFQDEFAIDDEDLVEDLFLAAFDGATPEASEEDFDQEPPTVRDASIVWLDEAPTQKRRVPEIDRERRLAKAS